MFFIFLCTIYICLHTLNILFTSSKQKHEIIIFSLSLALLNLYIYPSSQILSHIVPLFLVWIIVGKRTEYPQTCFLSLIISYSISYGLAMLVGFVCIILLSPIIYKCNPSAYFLIAIPSGLFQTFLVKSLFRLPRFKKGMPFLYTTKVTNISTLICLVIICFLLNTNSTIKNHKVKVLIILIFILTLAFLIYWWQAQITKAYRRNLELRELESMRTEMAELKKQMEELKAENDRLARITHRDNTLISALKNSTVKYLSTDFANPAVAEEVRNQLIENINTLSAERASLMTAHKEVSAREFATGLSLLDTLLHEMDEKALEMKITFAVHMGISLNEFIPNVVLESDLVHTVDDLLKNAFKATRSSEKRVVQLQFYKLGKNLVIEVADSGIPFEVKSLVNMGVEKLTTYEDGSGIGLMDIWNTKETYGATYHLEECVNAAPFTKKISLTFDKKNRYSIRTLRKDEILQASRRADLQVYDFSE